uniref:Uncharacterized protein n=1 Tax=Anguilla anguilla TaxID=7936 RepID=A0A0E9X0V2_ANGAN
MTAGKTTGSPSIINVFRWQFALMFNTKKTKQNKQKKKTVHAPCPPDYGSVEFLFVYVHEFTSVVRAESRLLSSGP